MPTFPTAANQDHVTLRDCTVLAFTPSPSGTAQSFIGIVKTVSFDLTREFKDTTAATDIAETARATNWKSGKLSIAGFSQLTGSKFTAAYIASSRSYFQFAEAASGDIWQFNAKNITLSKKMSADMTEDTLDYEWDGQPYYGAAGATPAALSPT